MDDSGKKKRFPSIGPMIRNRRKQLQLTLKNISERTGLSVAFISQIERDITSPSLSSLALIAKSLDVRTSYFLDIPEDKGLVTRKGNRTYFSLKNSVVTYSKVTNEFPDSQLNGVINRTPPGFVSEKVSHDGEDLVYAIQGEGFIQVGDEKYVLKKGDTIHYRGDIPHCWGNDSDEDFVWLGVYTQPIFTK